VAAVYALYSSATMLVLTLGDGTHGFTLDPASGEFLLTHPAMAVPRRGQLYSLNDARYHDWPAGLQRYVDAIRQGRGQNPVQYSARYICRRARAPAAPLPPMPARSSTVAAG